MLLYHTMQPCALLCVIDIDDVNYLTGLKDEGRETEALVMVDEGAVDL